MPVCKNCGSRLSKFDKDMCPVCGCKNPLEGVSSDTVEMTAKININNKNENYKPKKKSSLFILWSLLGCFGAGLFYVYESIRLMLLWLICNIVVASGLALICYQLSSILWLSILIGVAFIYIVNILIGLVFYFKKDLKDSRGEFFH